MHGARMHGARMHPNISEMHIKLKHRVAVCIGLCIVAKGALNLITAMFEINHIQLKCFCVVSC